MTEADKADDKKSINRKLDQKLIFVVNQKLGDDKAWILPQVLREQNENLRQVGATQWHHNNKGRIGSYFTWLGTSNEGDVHVWSVIYSFTTGTNCK